MTQEELASGHFLHSPPVGQAAQASSSREYSGSIVMPCDSRSRMHGEIYRANFVDASIAGCV